MGIKWDFIKLINLFGFFVSLLNYFLNINILIGNVVLKNICKFNGYIIICSKML